MGRRRTRLELDAAESALADRLARGRSDPRTAERARFALLAATGRYTLEELAERVGRQRSTLQLWLGKFAKGGLNGLLERDTPPGATSPLAGARLQRELRAGLKAGRWSSAAQLARWLAQEHGIERSRKSMYYWFTKHGVRAPGAAT